MENKNIYIKGARVNNLKNVDVTVPRNQLVVVTGVSGSGKSSLAFDTLYAEGQRRYVESLSAYARQFMGKMSKPECDFIRGLPPAIAIEQKVNTRNPRSTVGTSTEIYDYMRLLFARVGKTISPMSGKEVKKHTVEDVIATAKSYPEGTRIAISAPIHLPDKRRFSTQLDVYLKAGYSRLMQGTQFMSITDIMELDNVDILNPADYMLLIDRLAVAYDGDELSRLAEDAETAFFEGNDFCRLTVWAPGGEVVAHDFSRRFEADGMTFVEPHEQLFNFNNPIGACPKCEGFGRVLGIDEKLVVPNPTLSVYDDAVVCWRGEKMSEWKRALVRVASANNFPIHKPYAQLTDTQKEFLWHGNATFEGIDGFFRMLESNQYKIQYRVMLAHYRGKTTCPVCHGSRLRPEVQHIKVGGRNITELVRMSVDDLLRFFTSLHLSAGDEIIAERLMKEIVTRLTFLSDVGLGYLTLDRLSNTLSGGESQRINLATSLGSSLVGSLYILDEPSIGLHPRDTHRLIGVLRKLQQQGNTVVVVEHDEEIMRAADYIIDVGPDAGRLGGEIVYQGAASQLHACRASYTRQYLEGELTIPIPSHRRHSSSYIEVKGASEHNLKDIDVRFPLGALTVVTGVSGSGKSTLVRDILYRAMSRQLGNSGDAPGAFAGLGGDVGRIKAVEFIDQNPIGRSTRSNPATYLKAYDEIRRLFAEQQGAKQMGFTPAYFSFNTPGGRCEECKGEGTITIEMQFMADITITCEACHGQRFKPDVLDIRYMGANIHDVLEMTVNQAIEFFAKAPDNAGRKVIDRLKPLQDVGLGYIKLGQSSSTLSGGENQRVKLAYYLSMERAEPTMFIFDEPTTGLHPHDIATLLSSLQSLLERGHTLIIIEHNLDVIAAADHVIDIGPEGGDAGGNVVATGTPEEVSLAESSHTGQFLRQKLLKARQ